MPGAAYADGAPVAVDDAFSVKVAFATEIPDPGIKANDTGVGSLFVKVIDRPLQGKLSGGMTTGQAGFVYTPNDVAYHPKPDTFVYCWYDGGSCVSNPATVTLTMVKPVARPDAYYTPVDTVLSVPSKGVLANDDADGYSWSMVSAPSHGRVGSPAPTEPLGFDYIPNPAFVGSDTFSYCISFVIGSPSDCVSDPQTVTIQVGGTQVSRVAGVDRYEGAVKIAEQTHPGTSAALVVASGENYPDALSAGPVAVREKAPLLLVQGKSVPAVVAAKISKLAPMKVTVVGGVNTISDDVLNQIKSIVPPGATVTRVAGVDRYEVSRKLAESFSTASREYLATGTNFPDALSAGAAAGSVGAPVLLVNGPQPAADTATLETVKKLKSTAITLAGGSDSLSSGIENSLKALATVNRVQGVDRYATSVVLNKEAFASSTTAYLATGTNYPDALVGGVIAGANKAPLYVVPGTCVPQAVLDEFTRLGATKIVLLGGENSLSPDVEKLVPCT
ncbi:cell wall-binding repeat-containing protein [Herbiconiux sp. KACC 21604]|uniref:cell wall-binding repeat-containing protein n=1 Tax=unclassified Herbiconiux TaxID=2618217 RepID=UPI00149120ED|nr:cell wall-binding repeat-containing protein [Herbiconiux sp. SALV-R1]QJU52200.1 hypothetical protein HL652_00010 [Herbiconiux sp. SALV-R1]WPO87043.1 cell wall-binding repeat-containing protein [Herbiconiux sp. KACC 21604]